MALDPRLWMPKGMDDTQKDYWVTANPNDPHGAAADAWEDWAAQQDAAIGDGAVSITTGAQTITYPNGSGGVADAYKRAAWHRARARVFSVEVGPTITWGYLVEGEETIVETYDSPAMPVTRAGEFNQMTAEGVRRVGG